MVDLNAMGMRPDYVTGVKFRPALSPRPDATAAADQAS